MSFIQQPVLCADRCLGYQAFITLNRKSVTQRHCIALANPPNGWDFPELPTVDTKAQYINCLLHAIRELRLGVIAHYLLTFPKEGFS